MFTSPALVLVDPCNCVGVAGAGLSKQFRLRYPELSHGYRTACKRKILRPGKPLYQQANNGDIICRFPTKVHWKDDSTYEWIESGLLAISETPPVSWAIPKLGCGLGGLEWPYVRDMIYDAFFETDHTVYVYE